MGFHQTFLKPCWPLLGLGFLSFLFLSSSAMPELWGHLRLCPANLTVSPSCPAPTIVVTSPVHSEGNRMPSPGNVDDHRSLGTKQQLFFQHPLSPGSWFFLPHGTRVYNRLIEFIKAQYRNRGFQEVENQEFALKPVNCPGHCLMFKHRVRSYKELPLRFADFGVLHRKEANDALTELTRVQRFQQDDAHIFCRESQIKDEVRAFLEFVSYAYKIFGLTFDLNLSTRPEKYIGDIKTWVRAESALEEALNEFGKPWQKDEGEGAFYGPKIDISVSAALKGKLQCATLQLDFQLPARFNLSYSAEDEGKMETPVMIHRAILGSVERMLAVLLEHYKGKWPFWLSPRQAIICPLYIKSCKSFSRRVDPSAREWLKFLIQLHVACMKRAVSNACQCKECDDSA